MSTTLRIVAGFSLAAALAGLTGCHNLDREYLDPKVASQVVVTKAEPPSGCELIGFVKGSTYTGDLGDAHGEVLRSAVLRGGNYVSVDLVERPVIIGLGGYTVRGRLFSCRAPGAGTSIAAAPIAPAAPIAAAPAKPAPPSLAEGASKPCEPECASGFRCEIGVCVAAPAHAGR
jgi:hypothetical protein